MRLSSAAFFLLACSSCVDNEVVVWTSAFDTEPIQQVDIPEEQELGGQVCSAPGDADSVRLEVECASRGLLVCEVGDFLPEWASHGVACCASEWEGADCLLVGNPLGTILVCPDDTMAMCNY
jgi:hypothetical protein